MKGRKPRADAKLKLLPDEDQETFWRMLHPDDPEVTPSTLTDLAAFIVARYDFDTLSLSTLSEWHSWYALKRRIENARERADQTRLELVKDGSLSPEDIERAAQAVFTAESLEAGNVKAFVALAKLRLASQQLELDRDRLNAASRTKIEAGLDALFAEIKGNKAAEAIFAQLKAEVAKG